MSRTTRQLSDLAQASILLVALDFDGTIAPIAARPELARADEAALAALQRLAVLPRTFVAVISGRDVQTLRRLVGPLPGVRLIGSHGLEPDTPEFMPAADVSDAEAKLLESWADRIAALVGQTPGAQSERKPLSVTFHYRHVPDEKAGPMVAALREAAANTPLRVVEGHRVIEFLVRPGNKGTALNALRHRVGATGVVFAGDDATDEAAFAVLAGSDLGYRIGPGESIASHRLGAPDDFALILAQLLILRQDWLDSVRVTPINHHSMLSDQRTVALLDDDGDVAWMCLPRIDSPPVFSRLLCGDARGSFRIGPADDTGAKPFQRYVEDSLVVETGWPGFRVTDYFDASAGKSYQRAGRTDFVRVVEATGTDAVRVAMEFAPRLDFGRAETRLALHSDGLEITGWPDPIVLVAPGVEWTLERGARHDRAGAQVELRPGAPLVLELRYGTGSFRAAAVGEVERRTQTQKFWSGWARSLRLPGLHDDAVLRSALVLKGLCHGPTGAIAAAGTTSLPAPLGGVRNWDYRYCWPRDASLAARALLRLGNTGSAIKLLDWLVGIVEGLESPDRLRPIYSVNGGNLGAEAEISELPGYAFSRPVRVGNAAAYQVQLDVFGPIVDVVAALAESGAPVTPQYWRLVEMMVAAVATRWHEPDHGIWEIRSARRHHVHSKTMCWVAVQRALVVAEYVTGKPRAEWTLLADTIRNDVLANGYHAGRGAFVGAYGEPHLDAAALLVGLSGLVDPRDTRFVSTVEAVERELRAGAVVHRYFTEDGLPGVEGGFLLCAAWQIEAMALVGRRSEARARFEEYLKLAGPTGLMAEQQDPRTGEALGNFPQAYSHLGVINCSCTLASET